MLLATASVLFLTIDSYYFPLVNVNGQKFERGNKVKTAQF